jgi:hypothetical protein
MDAKILFCKHWWRVCYRRYQDTKGRTRKVLRAEMRETVKTVLELRNAEVSNGK